MKIRSNHYSQKATPHPFLTLDQTLCLNRIVWLFQALKLRGLRRRTIRNLKRSRIATAATAIVNREATKNQVRTVFLKGTSRGMWQNFKGMIKL